MKYSFCRLWRNQYSWKNDRGALFIFYVPFLLMFAGLGYTSGTDLLNSIVIGLFITTGNFTLYHTAKLIILGSACGFVSHFANKGNLEAIKQYKEMSTWRQ